MTDRPESVARGRPGLERLKALLREMFQLDRGDLDFGLYRIMNLKAREVEAFLEDELLPQAESRLRLATDRERQALEADLERKRRAARNLGVDPDEAPAVLERNRRLDEMRKDARVEADVHTHLANFFARYYTEGDFVSQRRYSAGGASAYLIPYDGEEVKLHWANADQYYIKTTENFASYAFRLGAGEPRRRARFEVVAADGRKDDIKAVAGRQRRFVLAPEVAVGVAGEELVVRFAHRPLTDAEKQKWPGNGSRQQGRINEAAARRILQAAPEEWRALLGAPAPTEANSDRTVLAMHLERYTAKNTFDYFIHKDLGGFLRRQLDLYLNSEVLDLDDLDQGDAARLELTLARVRAIRDLGRKIIAFLTQLEEFQKRLWLKRKFVLETRWCVTLDRVPETLYPEIAANDSQRAEWVRLFAIDRITGHLGNGGAGYTEPLGVEFLRQNPFLVLDTRHFDADFTDRLLAALSDAAPLDEQTDGLLIHGENFHALNLLSPRFRGKVECAYLDPPYNTGDSEILYKNGYPKASWLTLMDNRLELLVRTLAPDSVLYIAIDDFEMVDLSQLIDSKFDSLQREVIVVNHYPQGGKATALAHTHEYMLACLPASSTRTLVGRPRETKQELRPFKRSGTAESNFRFGRPRSFYAVLVHPESHRVVGLEPPPEGSEYPTEPTDEGFLRIYPVDANSGERVWRRSFASAQDLVRKGKLRCSSGRAIYQAIEAHERTDALFSNWVSKRYNAGTHGANLLQEMMGDRRTFAYPKSLYTVEDAIFAARLQPGAWVLDCFAGSGTTGHALIDLNRADDGGRKYVMIEVADHFDTVLIPRLKKAVYSPDWKSGRPVSRKGVSQLFRCLRIESFEDAMDSLVRTPPSPGRRELLARNPKLAEDYRLRYALGEETAASATLLGTELRDPFAHTLSVVRDGVRRETAVDLPETFDLLLGLEVEARRRIDGVLTITGTDAEGRRCLILWRNLDEMDHAALDGWFSRNRERFGERLEVIWTNGDHTLNAMRRKGENWTAETIEPVFRALMFPSEP